MSAVEQRRPKSKPLVYAQPRAIEQAARLGLDGCLENHVAAAILAGKKRRQPPTGLLPRCRPDERAAFIGPDGSLVARLKRWTSPLGRPAWICVSVQPAPPTTSRRSAL